MAVTVTTLATALGRATPTGVTADQWTMWIADARMLLSSGDGSHAGLGDLALLDQTVVDYVVREAVVAHILRPEDATQVDVQIDDARVLKRYSSSAGRIIIRPEWWGLLDVDLLDSAAFTITPYAAPDSVVLPSPLGVLP